MHAVEKVNELGVRHLVRCELDLNGFSMIGGAGADLPDHHIEIELEVANQCDAGSTNGTHLSVSWVLDLGLAAYVADTGLEETLAFEVLNVHFFDAPE